MSFSYGKFDNLSRGTPSLRKALVRFHIDVPLLLLISITLVIGLFILYSASSHNLVVTFKQILRIIFGLLIMWAIALVPPATIKRWTPNIYIAGLVLLVLVVPFGIEVNGARRWLGQGSFRFQPSEIFKIATPMMVAWMLADAKLPLRFVSLLLGLIIIGIPTVFIAIEPDLGTAVLVFMSGFIVLFLAGLRWWIIALAVILLAASAVPIWKYVLHDYQRERIATLIFSDEAKNRKGSHWQSDQSKIAIGSGGIYGKGYLQGTQSRHGFLPESETDFIFAVIGEEFGLAGAIFLLMLYLLILFRGLAIALSAQDTFSRLLAGTLSLIFIVYVCINMLMVSGLLPVVGLPLPMISFGGTSVVTILASFGMLMSIQTHRKLI